MDTDTYAPGMPCWNDIGSPDPAATAAFYSALFGWEVLDLGDEAGGYRMCSLQGRTVAGIGPQQVAGVPPWWATYFAVDSVEAASAAVVANGGTIIAPAMDVMDAGRMAVLADPQGAVFSVWQAGNHPGSGIGGVLGTRCWAERATRHPDATAAFYAAVFGWRPVEFTGSHYIRFEHGDDAAGGMLHMDETFPPDMPESWVVYFFSPDVAATCAKAAELGATILMPPTPIPRIGQFAVICDPQGAVFNLLQPDPPA